MLSPGSLRSGGRCQGGSHDAMRPVTQGILVPARHRPERARRSAGRPPSGGIHRRTGAPAGGRALGDRARSDRRLPGGRDPPGDLRESGSRSVGRRDREGRLLGAPHRGRAVSGVRGELRASGMSSALVRAVTPVHVSVPRWCVLRGRLARVRAAAARPVRIRISGPRWRALGTRRTATDPLETGVSTHGRGPIRSTLAWLEERAGLGGAIAPTLDHPVPRSTASWWYVFGSATLALFVLQIATGICLALVYVPSADGAYQSLLYLNYQAPFGWFLRAVHFWGSNAMVAVMTLHMIQVFLWGAHKYPRELTWIVGVFLFLCTLGMAFTGQLMRWDQDAYWGLGIGASIAARTPFVGQSVVHLILGGPIIAGGTLSRVFTAHVFLIPGILIALVGLHLWLVLRLGVNEWPMPGRLVDRQTYRLRYMEEIHPDGVPFVPDVVRKDMVSMAVAVLLVLACAAIFGPFGSHGVPEPAIIDTVPNPDFYFLALFALFALLPPWTETALLLIGPPLAIALLLAVPFLAGAGEEDWERGPAP